MPKADKKEGIVMAKKLNCTCPNCGSEICKFTECKEVIFICQKCKASFMITATAKEITIKIRQSSEYQIQSNN